MVRALAVAYFCCGLLLLGLTFAVASFELCLTLSLVLQSLFSIVDLYDDDVDGDVKVFLMAKMEDEDGGRGWMPSNGFQTRKRTSVGGMQDDACRI